MLSRLIYNHNSWDNNLAYVVGLLTTDGNLSPDGRHLEFNSKDLEQVENLKNLLNLNNQITSKSSGSNPSGVYWRIQFGNVSLYRWLLEIGLTPNKSKSLSVLSIPNQYFPDFLRGHLDGDGNIRVYNDPKYPTSKRLYVTFNSASSLHLEWLQNTINQLFFVSGYISQTNGALRLTFAKKESITLLSRIYYKFDLPFLRRKYELAKPFLQK